MFIWMCGVLVLLMHIGFSMLEVGCVQPKNRSSILLKNIMCLCIGGMSWWAVGYLLANGVNMDNKDNHGFLGTNDGDDTYAFMADVEKTGSNYINWFFGFAFAATAATIVSGAVAERIQYRAYFIFAAVLTGVVYPVVAYWGWATNGWLKVAGTKDDANRGYLDFAGSGIVHMVGGCAALVSIIVLGPREHMTVGKDQHGKPVIAPRFEQDEKTKQWYMNQPENDGSGQAFAALGTLILWVGWFGFNPGSQLAISTTSDQMYVGIAIVNTVLGPCAAVTVYALIAGLLGSHVDVGGTLNAALTGLVAVTANCNYTESWAAALIGALAAPVYIGSSKLLKVLRIDDVIDAVPVHFCGGIWGVIATGLFVSDDLAGDHDAGLFYDGSELILWQICGVVVISAWTAAFTIICMLALKFGGWLRLSAEEEEKGMDLIMQELAASTGMSTEITASHPVSPRSSPTARTPMQVADIESAMVNIDPKEENPLPKTTEQPKEENPLPKTTDTTSEQM